jgi:DNA-binding transcriptional MerR regulator
MPGVTRDQGKRRLYRTEHIDWLNFLDRLRFTGMTVKDMQAYAAFAAQGKASLEARQKFLQAHRERVLERIADMTRAAKLIDLKIAFYSEWERTGFRPAHLPKQRFSARPTDGGFALSSNR